MILPDLARAAEAIARKGGELGRPLHVLRSTTSTNDEAKRAAKEGAPHGSTWVAETQTEGRGRQGRTWVSSPGENLLFSVLMRLACPPARVPQLALVCGLAVQQAVSELGLPARIKWPNDVLVEGKKIAGVLVESTLGSREHAVIAGIGINVHARDFPPEIAARATSLSLLGVAADRGELLAAVLHFLDRDASLVASRGLGLVSARLSAADALLGQRVTSESGEGVAQGIDPEGRLLVRGDDGVLVRWSAGEVHLSRDAARHGS
jgi:BirA family biotin operon repressor/biotin-[acetyl-CoA-carboxylase] ligase